MEASQEVSRVSLPAQLEKQLRRDILGGALKAGQVLRQEELAQRFNVSRVPLREALSRLEADGLIDLRPRKGYAVAQLDPQEIVEIFDIRQVLEEHAGRVAALTRTQADVDELEQLIHSMEALDPKNKEQRDQWALANYDFHLRLIASGRRKRLTRIAFNLRDVVEPYVNMEVAVTGDVLQATREHREMLEAFRAGDAAGLAALCRSHVAGTAERLLAGIRHRAADALGSPTAQPNESTWS
jgi:DNA-binding GntR family transcriptional regulator